MKRFLIVAVTTFCALPAAAVNFNFCFQGYATYTDNHDDRPALANGVREDYFTDDSFKALRGVYASVTGGSANFADYTADGLGATAAGCTGNIDVGTLPRQVTIYLESRAKSQTHEIRATDASSQNLRTLLFTHVLTSSSASTQTFTWNPTAQVDKDILGALNAAAFAMYRHYGGVSGASFVIRVQDASDVTTSLAGYDALVKLSTNGGRRKFVIVHEFGHAILRYRLTSGNLSGGDCTDSFAGCPAPGHRMGSRELQKCAAQEGFAHFYSADVFNSHNSEECANNYYVNEFGLGLPSVDCEAAASDQSVNGSYPRAFMENKPCGVLWNGRGVEVDWMRTFWNIHSEQDSPGPVSFNDIMAWLDGPDLTQDDNIYSPLDAEANIIGGPLDWWWSLFSASHGIDHLK